MLHELLTRAAERGPEATAVALDNERMSYAELATLSDSVAGTLQGLGVAPGDRVCLLSGKTPRAIAAILGVLKAGAVYVPLDPSSPPARTRRMLEAAETRWLLVGRDGVEAARQLVERRELVVGALDDYPAGAGPVAAFRWSDMRHGGPLRDTGPANDERVAYIMFTSGSTGVPKGVAVRHRNVMHVVSWAVEYFGIAAHDRISGHPPLHFDLSVLDLFSAVAAGAALELVPSRLNILPAKLAAFIRERALTQWFSVPAALNLLIKSQMVQEGDFPALRRLLWCGDVLPTPVLRELMQRLPHVAFTNLYGPTETTVASSYYTVPACPADDHEAIPIGRAIPGEELVALDQDARVTPPGCHGDLYVGGAGLALGYWRDDIKTQAAFVPDPRPGREGQLLYRTGDIAHCDSEGRFFFHGRADLQIKSRGHRIELGEIETALAVCPELRESAVVAVPTHGFEGMTICCAYVPTRDVALGDLREALRERLPPYMLPTRWMALDRIPKTPNGKTDRSRLRDLFAVEVAVS